jgi:hypothetical protein
MLITPANTFYVQSSVWLLQLPLPMSIHQWDYSSSLCLCPVISLISPSPSVYVQSSCWLLQQTLSMSSRQSDYSSSFCLCPVISLITPAPSAYDQSSCWIIQLPLPMSSHQSDYSSSLCLCPVIMLISAALFMFSHHAQKLLVSHYVRRHVISVLGRGSLNNPLPKVFTYYENFVGCDRVVRHSACREGRGGDVTFRCGVLSQLWCYSISGMLIPAVQRLTACGLEQYIVCK